MDMYDRAVNFLKANPHLIADVWDDPKSHFTGILFQAVTPSGCGEENPEGLFCGDLCEIHSFLAHGWTEPLEEAIGNDHRLPKIFSSNNGIPKITPDHLPVFAEWQRKIDVMLNRKPENFKILD